VALNYRKLTLQIGRGEFTPLRDDFPNLEVNWYRYKETLANDMKEAQLIISHGGKYYIK
jgi:beta-1,4-N-acetylglucosaminyltransferase